MTSKTRFLNVGFVATDSERDKWIIQKLLKVSRACVNAAGSFVAQKDPEDAHLEFVLTGESKKKARVSIDLTGRKAPNSLCNQPAFYDLIIAGERPPKDPWTKIKGLDDPKYKCLVVRPDGYPLSPEIPQQVAMTESELLADLSRMDEVSHALIIASEEAFPAIAKLLIHRIAVVFGQGGNKKFSDPTLIIPASSYGDFINKAKSMSASKQSSPIFDKHLKHRVFGKNELRASSARSLIGSLLRKSYGLDHGFLYHKMGDDRLWTLATTDPKPIIELPKVDKKERLEQIEKIRSVIPAGAGLDERMK